MASWNNDITDAPDCRIDSGTRLKIPTVSEATKKLETCRERNRLGKHRGQIDACSLHALPNMPLGMKIGKEVFGIVFNMSNGTPWVIVTIRRFSRWI